MPPDRWDCCGDGDLQLAPAKQLGNGIDAVGDVPAVAKIALPLPPIWPARISACKPSQASGEMRSFAPRRCGGASSAAFTIALPPTLSSSHTIAQHLRRLTDACDTLFLEKTKQSQAIGSGLVT